MAYVSFRVRRADLVASPDANPFGSYVRGVDATAPTGLTRADSDFALRADGFIRPVPDLFMEARFSATARSYDNVFLEWSEFEMTDPALNGSGDTAIQGVVIVYSKTGAPETVADGTILRRQEFDDDLFSFEHVVSTPGEWAYYSMFLHWNQNGSGISGVNWYERVATLQELIPDNYGSIDTLWSRIPAQYRDNDFVDSDDPEDSLHGHLHRLLEVFGFEMDRARTLIDSVIAQYDPRKTESESIAQLAKMLGLEVGVEDIGVSRIRQIIQDIGYYRKRKGTLQAAQKYLTALSGCDVDVVESGTSPRYTFRVYAEKSNLVADSLFVITTGTKKWELSGETASVSYTHPEGKLTVTNSGSASAQFAIISQAPVPVDGDIDYWMSINMTASAGDIYGAQWATASTAWADWGTEDLSVNIMPESLSPTGRTVILMPEQTSASALYPVMLFNLASGASMDITEWMVEPNKYGNFFNGDSDFGGFIYQNTFSDHQWAGSEYASYSTYTTNRKVIHEAVARLLPKLLPVTMLIDTTLDYTIIYDWIPNKT